MSFEQELQQAEGYCELGMWQQAYYVLEDLLLDAKISVPVLLLHVRILLGTGEVRKALLLVSSVAGQVPTNCEVEAAVCGVLIANAKAEAAAGEVEAAKVFLRQCIALDPERRLEILSAPELSNIW